MVERTVSGRPSRAFIESDRIEGTAVSSSDGALTGRIKRLIIEKASGRVAFVVVAFGDVVHAVPWGTLHYDPGFVGYRTDIAERQLRDAPAFARGEDHDWSKLERGDELDAFYAIPPHLRAI